MERFILEENSNAVSGKRKIHRYETNGLLTLAIYPPMAVKSTKLKRPPNQDIPAKSGTIVGQK